MAVKSGDIYNYWTVIERDYITPRKNKNPYWFCKCECGKIKSVQQGHLIDGTSKSCGCHRNDNKLIDLTKEEFKDFIVLGIDHKEYNNNGSIVYWKCQCKYCNNIFVGKSQYLREGWIHCDCIKVKSRMETWFKELIDTYYPDINYTTQWTHEDLKDKQLLKIDFCLEIDGDIILVELDGQQHYDENNHYYSSVMKQHDEMKDAFAINMGLPLYRIKYTTSKAKLKNYLDAIYKDDIQWLKENCYNEYNI